MFDLITGEWEQTRKLEPVLEGGALCGTSVAIVQNSDPNSSYDRGTYAVVGCPKKLNEGEPSPFGCSYCALCSSYLDGFW